MAIKITKGNKSDLSKALTGKLFDDKAYISKALSSKFYARNLPLFTGICRDMNNHLLKNRMNLEHTRHRSPLYFLVHIIACIVIYAITKYNLSRTV